MDMIRQDQESIIEFNLAVMHRKRERANYSN